MNVWKLTLYHENEEYDRQPPEIRDDMLHWAIREERIALGWGEVSNVPECDSRKKCAQAIRNMYPDLRANNRRNIAHGGDCLYNFCHVMQNGDLVILVGKNSKREAVMKIGDENGRHGEYFREPTKQPPPVGNYQHQRRATKVGGHEEADKLWKKANGRIEGARFCALTRLILPE